MTISERHFEAFRRQAQLECARLPETDESTADYSVLIGGQTVIAEVKEIEANEADLQAVRDMETKHSAVWGTNKVGSRVRNKIDAAKRQIQALPGLWGDFSLSGKRVHVEAAEMEEYVGLESLAVAVAA